MAHQEYRELLEPYALDALNGIEVRQLEEHLSGCDECRAVLVELRDTAGLMALSSTPIAPRDDLRERILSAARAEARPSRTSAKVIPITKRPAVQSRSYFLRIAAILVLAFLSIGLMVMWQRNASLKRELARLAGETNLQQRELEREREARRRDQEALALLGARDAKTMQLAGTQTAQTARAMFVFDQKSGRAVLMTEGLPATPTAKAYEVWFIPKGHAPMPGKVFTVDSTGHAMLMDQMPPEAMQNAIIAITLEPEKGSSTPTGAIYLSSPAS
jgi:Anti-sigma-K factor rskA, C-terminal/Putative zinc-finger